MKSTRKILWGDIDQPVWMYRDDLFCYTKLNLSFLADARWRIVVDMEWRMGI
jgi:hypothetical protein